MSWFHGEFLLKTMGIKDRPIDLSVVFLRLPRSPRKQLERGFPMRCQIKRPEGFDQVEKIVAVEIS